MIGALDDVESRMYESTVRALRDRRQVFEHREEIDHLLGSDRAGAVDDALALVIHANRRNT